MVEQELTPQPEPARKRSRRVWIGASVAGVLIVAAGAVSLWFLNDQVHSLRQQLGASERRAMSAEQEALQTARELTSTQSRMITVQQRALQAEQQARQLDTAKRESESQLDALREESQQQLSHLRQQSETAAAAAEKAAAEKKQALAARQQAVAELESMRQRRAEELDKMQQALNHIAPTHRTATGMVMQLANDSFNFDFDSAALKPQNRELLSRVAGVLLASEGYRLFVDGHTDDVGSDTYNEGLSKRRAQSVRDYLVKAGVPADIITTNGFGKSNPLINAKSREAREKNRRVEIGIVDTIIKYDTAAASQEP